MSIFKYLLITEKKNKLERLSLAIFLAFDNKALDNSLFFETFK
jgi:hypothetical protein